MGIYLNYVGDDRTYDYHLLPVQGFPSATLCGKTTSHYPSGRVEIDRYWLADHQDDPIHNPVNKSLSEFFGTSLCQECLDKVKSSC